MDKNQDGELTGDELRYLAVWIDRDGDAKITGGAGPLAELVPASQVVTSISVRPARDPKGDAWVEGVGAVLNDGRVVSSYAWWPRMRYDKFVNVGEDGKEHPPLFIHFGDTSQLGPLAIYRWLPVPESLPNSGPDSEGNDIVGGYLRFFKEDGALYVLAVSTGTTLEHPAYEGGPSEQFCVIAPVKVVENDQGVLLEWRSNHITNKAHFREGRLEGVTFGPGRYFWTATLATEDTPLAQSLAIADLAALASVEGDLGISTAYLDVLSDKLSLPPLVLTPWNGL